MASEAALENATVDELNASNLTGRDAASAGGILITYTSLFMMALAPIVIGSLRSVSYHHHLKVRQGVWVGRVAVTLCVCCDWACRLKGRSLVSGLR